MGLEWLNRIKIMGSIKSHKEIHIIPPNKKSRIESDHSERSENDFRNY